MRSLGKARAISSWCRGGGFLPAGPLCPRRGRCSCREEGARGGRRELREGTPLLTAAAHAHAGVPQTDSRALLPREFAD